jgi:2-methylcitrate dehydratase PrpD
MTIPRRTFLRTSALAGGAAASVVFETAPARAARRASPALEAEAEDVTRRLAGFVVRSRPADVPAGPRKEAARSILNWVGCALGGSRHDTVERALQALDEFSGPRKATVLGRAGRLDALHAALLNGISSHVLDYDDTHLETIIHPAGPVLPAILALSELRRARGEEFLHAFVLGVEVECRIGKAVYPSHYDVGWHITGTAGVFGAAAAAGKLLGLDERQMAWALGIAATQSSGLREMFGSMCKALHPGRAAQNGLAAALLAAKGFTSSERSIEAPRGFAHVLATERKLSRVTDGLGESFEISRNTYKPFACGIVVHPVIDACLQLRREHVLSADLIDRVDLRVHPLVLELTGKKTPATGLEAKFSVYHSAAVAILRGAAGPGEYTDAVARDPAVIALRGRVRAEPRNGVREEEAYATIVLKDGRRLEKHVEHAVGSLERPMSDADLERKFHGLADGVLKRARADRLIALCWSVASSRDAAEIARASAPS